MRERLLKIQVFSDTQVEDNYKEGRCQVWWFEQNNDFPGQGEMLGDTLQVARYLQWAIK